MSIVFSESQRDYSPATSLKQTFLWCLTLPDPTSPMMVVSVPDFIVSEISLSVVLPESTDQFADAFISWTALSLVSAFGTEHGFLYSFSCRNVCTEKTVRCKSLYRGRGIIDILLLKKGSLLVFFWWKLDTERIPQKIGNTFLKVLWQIWNNNQLTGIPVRWILFIVLSRFVGVYFGNIRLTLSGTISPPIKANMTMRMYIENFDVNKLSPTWNPLRYIDLRTKCISTLRTREKSVKLRIKIVASWDK